MPGYTAKDFKVRADMFSDVPGGIDEDIVLVALRIAARVMRPGLIEGACWGLDVSAEGVARDIRAVLLKDTGT